MKMVDVLKSVLPRSRRLTGLLLVIFSLELLACLAGLASLRNGGFWLGYAAMHVLILVFICIAVLFLGILMVTDNR